VGSPQENVRAWTSLVLARRLRPAAGKRAAWNQIGKAAGPEFRPNATQAQLGTVKLDEQSRWQSESSRPCVLGNLRDVAEPRALANRYVPGVGLKRPVSISSSVDLPELRANHAMRSPHTVKEIFWNRVGGPYS